VSGQAALLIQGQKIEALLCVRKSREFLLDNQQILTKAGWVFGDPLLQMLAFFEAQFRKGPGFERLD